MTHHCCRCPAPLPPLGDIQRGRWAHYTMAGYDFWECPACVHRAFDMLDALSSVQDVDLADVPVIVQRAKP